MNQTLHGESQGVETLDPEHLFLEVWMNFSMQPLVSGAAGRHLSGDRGPTVREAVEAFIAGINDGSLRDRSGRVNKPSARRGYERELRARVVVAFGGSRRRSSSAMMRTPLIAASSLRARDWI